ncbi:MAG: ABC transporter permease [Bryobacterales bacterium]
MFFRLGDFLRSFFGRRRFEREMSSELRFHMEAYTEDLVRSGVPRGEAERRARLEFGGVERVREECRQSRGLRWSDELARNVRFALRTLRRSPVFAVTAIVTLALCIGANTAIYSVVDTVLLRPLPYPEPDRLGSLVVQVRTAGGGGMQNAHTGATWEGIRDGVTSIDTVVHNNWRQGVSLVSGDQVEYVSQQRVGAGFFRVLGVSLLRGREFTAQEDVPGGAAVTVLSYPLWKRLFGEETEAIGESILLRGEPFTVVGVAPPGFQSTVPADVWTPLRPSRTGEGSGTNYEITVRLPQETSWPEAQAQIRAVGAGLLQDDKPDGVEAYFAILPLQESLTRGIRDTLLLLWGAVGAVLLIGCVNIAGLLLARVGERQHEIATRMALGGGRGAVLRQLLTEAIVLGLLGGVAGVVLGYAGLRALEILGAGQFGMWQPLAIDGRVLGVTLLTALSAAVLFGLAPAIQACRLDVRSGLTESASRSVAGGRRRWMRRAMVAGEVALVMVLLVNAGALIRSYARLQGLDPGFDSTNVMTAQVPLQDARYKTTSSVARLFNESLDRIRELPGVESAAVGLSLPFQFGFNLPFERPGVREEGRTPITNMAYVTPDYFRALRIPLVQGRLLRETDTADATKVVLVNEAFVEWYMDGDEPVGAFLKISGLERQVVGVVGDVQQMNAGAQGPLLRELPSVYMPVAQTSEGFMPLVHTWFQPSWIVRTTGPQQGLIGHIQNSVAAVDPQLPFAGFRTMDEVRGGVLAGQRFRVVLLGTLAGLALVLAAVGLYGLIANTVVERTREMGIRLALGATGSQAVRSVALPGLGLGLAGVFVGGAGAWMSASVIASLVWGVSMDDPWIFGAVAVCLMLIVSLASFLPALRVARLNPAETLRKE